MLHSYADSYPVNYMSTLSYYLGIRYLHPKGCVIGTLMGGKSDHHCL